MAAGDARRRLQLPLPPRQGWSGVAAAKQRLAAHVLFGTSPATALPFCARCHPTCRTLLQLKAPLLFGHSQIPRRWMEWIWLSQLASSPPWWASAAAVSGAGPAGVMQAMHSHTGTAAGEGLRRCGTPHAWLVGPALTCPTVLPCAGKSTLVSLIQRLYDPSAGAVLLDGTDLRWARAAPHGCPWMPAACCCSECCVYGRPPAALPARVIS